MAALGFQQIASAGLNTAFATGPPSTTLDRTPGGGGGRGDAFLSTDRTLLCAESAHWTSARSMTFASQVPPARSRRAPTRQTSPSLSRDALEATHAESPDDHTEFIPGLANGGEVSPVINFWPEQASQGATARFLKEFQDGRAAVGASSRRSSRVRRR